MNVTTGAPIDARFPGQWFQMESGLHQNWMRDYDPTTGRYIEPDPLGLVDGASIYGNARQNPGRYTDPRGESVTGVFRRSPWGRGAAIGGVLGEGVNVLFPNLGASLASGLADITSLGLLDPEGTKLGPLDDAIRRADAAEENGQCPDPCDSARRRLQKAKDDAQKLGGCRANGLSYIEYLQRYDAFRELLFARAERDNICHGGPDAGHTMAQIQAMNAMKRCESKMTGTGKN